MRQLDSILKLGLELGLGFWAGSGLGLGLRREVTVLGNQDSLFWRGTG